MAVTPEISPEGVKDNPHLEFDKGQGGGEFSEL